MLVKGGSAGLDGRVDGRQERDLGDERVTEGSFNLKKLAQEMALGNAMVGLGKALARQFVGLSAPPSTAQGRWPSRYGRQTTRAQHSEGDGDG